MERLYWRNGWNGIQIRWFLLVPRLRQRTGRSFILLPGLERRPMGVP